MKDYVGQWFKIYRRFEEPTDILIAVEKNAVKELRTFRHEDVDGAGALFQLAHEKKWTLQNLAKSKNRRVVITGMGMVTPLGLNKTENWENLKIQKSGVRDLTKEPYANDLPKNCKYGATIQNNFDAKKYRTLVYI